MKNLFIAMTVIFQFSNTAIASSNKQTINVWVTEKGFEPTVLKVKQNQDISLSITRKTDSTCAKEIIFPAQKIKKELPLNKAVTIKLGKLKKGDIHFSCGMDMVSGVINVQ